MVQEISAARTTDVGPDGGEPDPADGAPPAAVRTTRVPLERLLSVVGLNPAQATLVALRVLEATRPGTPLDGTLDGNGPGTATGPAGTGRWAVAVTTAGEVEVAAATTSGTTAEELLALLARNARRLPAHPGPAQLALLHGLEEVAARPGPGAGAGELEAALIQALGPDAVRRLARELAALVTAFTRVAPSVAAPVPALAPAAVAPAPAPAASGSGGTGAHRAVPTRPGPARPWHRRALGHRRTVTRRVAVLALLLAAVLAGSGYVALRGQDGASDETSGTTSDGATGPGRGSAGPSAASPSPSQGTRATRSGRDRGAQSLAPRTAGAVTGVELLRSAACTPGTACPVTVRVHLSPATAARAVTWRTGAARWCRPGAGWSAPVTVTAQPGWTSVYATSTVVVPRGPSRALVALTSAPARVQSPPVPATGSAPRC